MPADESATGVCAEIRDGSLQGAPAVHVIQAAPRCRGDRSRIAGPISGLPSGTVPAVGLPCRERTPPVAVQVAPGTPAARATHGLRMIETIATVAAP